MPEDKNFNFESGVSLIITFFIMIIILSVVLFISVLLYSEVKVIKNIGDSMVSFYAADSGIEKVLYYDRKVLPVLSVFSSCQSALDCDSGQSCISGSCVKYAVRGLCSMYNYDSANNPNACLDSSTVSGLDPGLFCNNTIVPAIYADDTNNPKGCNPDTCNDCYVSFNTALSNGSNYHVSAEVYPSEDGKSSDFKVESKGSFGSAQRQIETLIASPKPGSGITIENACVVPVSTPQGQTIDISADVTAMVFGDTIGSVKAVVHDANGVTVANLSLSLYSGTYMSGTWKYSWPTGSTLAKAYYVDIEATDTGFSKTNNLLYDKKCKNIQPGALCAGVCN